MICETGEWGIPAGRNPLHPVQAGKGCYSLWEIIAAGFTQNNEAPVIRTLTSIVSNRMISYRIAAGMF